MTAKSGEIMYQKKKMQKSERRRKRKKNKTKTINSKMNLNFPKKKNDNKYIIYCMKKKMKTILTYSIGSEWILMR